MNSVNQYNKPIQAAALAAVLVVALSSPAKSQSQTLRNPLVPGALSADAGDISLTPLPPPPGDEGDPASVTPGMSGSPGYEPWVTSIPANTAGVQDSQVNLGVQPSDALEPGAFQQQVGSSIPNQPSTPGTDPGILAPNNSGYQPPAAVVNINPQGGMPGDQAPQQKWNGQTSRDFGKNMRQGNNSRSFDFGQKLSQRQDLANQPQDSQDGPRPFIIPTDYNSPARQPQLPNAQQTTDLGIRMQFKGQYPFAQQTQVLSSTSGQSPYSSQAMTPDPSDGQTAGQYGQPLPSSDFSSTGAQSVPGQYSYSQQASQFPTYVPPPQMSDAGALGDLSVSFPQ